MQLLRNIFKALFSKSLQPLNNLGSSKTFEEKLKELGVFSFDEGGFRISSPPMDKYLKWVDITEINVYKADLMTIDRIEMEIFYGEKMMIITEDLPGWYQFVLKSKDVFPEIPKDWDIEIIQPPFATNYRTIYRRF